MIGRYLKAIWEMSDNMTNVVKMRKTVQIGVLLILVLWCATENTIAAGKSEIVYRVDNKLPKFVEQIVGKAVRNVLSFYEAEYGLTLDKLPIITLSQDPKYHMRYRSGARKPKKHDRVALGFAKQQCQLKYGPATGWANPASLHLCFRNDVALTARQLRKDQISIEFLLAHELRHVFQYQFTKLAHAKIRKIRWFGPAWLIEGDATEFQLEYYIHQYGKGWSSDWLIGKVKDIKPNLDAFNTYAHPRFASDGYLLGHFATWMLKRRFGQARIDAYWKQLRRGEGLEKAFRQTFNMTISDFSKDVHRAKKSREHVEKWIAGS